MMPSASTERGTSGGRYISFSCPGHNTEDPSDIQEQRPMHAVKTIFSIYRKKIQSHRTCSFNERQRSIPWWWKCTKAEETMARYMLWIWSMIKAQSMQSFIVLWWSENFSDVSPLLYVQIFLSSKTNFTSFKYNEHRGIKYYCKVSTCLFQYVQPVSKQLETN